MNPSEVHSVPWLYAVHDPRFESGDNTRKWRTFWSPQCGDEWWEKISAATLAGDLGPVSKASTVSRGGRRVICVYAQNTDEERETLRIREKLRELGITWVIRYKADWQTAAGISGSLFSA